LIYSWLWRMTIYVLAYLKQLLRYPKNEEDTPQNTYILYVSYVSHRTKFMMPKDTRKCGVGLTKG